MKAVPVESPKSLCCAKCTRPAGDVQFKLGRFIYGVCCVELAELELEMKESK
jgi:hypothetical protein